MNSSNNQEEWQQLKEKVLEDALNRIGMNRFQDSLYIIIFPLLGIGGFLGNIMSIWILSGPQFAQKPLYAYLKVSCINSTFMNIIHSLNFLWHARHTLPIANTKLALYLLSYFKHPVMFITYSYGCIIDIVLALERLSELTNSRDRFRQFRPYRVCLVLFLADLFINLPLFFAFEPQTEYLTVDPSLNLTVEFFHLGRTEFSKSRVGFVLNLVLYFTRDILTLIVLVIMNIAAYVLFRRNYKNYVERSLSSLAITERNQFLEMRFMSDEKNSPPSEYSMRRYNEEKSSKVLFLILSRSNKSKVYFRVAQANRMMSKMVFLICSFSTFEHIFFILAVQLYETYLKPIKLFIIIMTNLIMLLKHSINFFIFYSYNSLFRTRFLKIVNRSK